MKGNLHVQAVGRHHNPNPWPPSSLNGKYYGYDQWWDVNGDHKPRLPSTDRRPTWSPRSRVRRQYRRRLRHGGSRHGSWDLNPARRSSSGSAACARRQHELLALDRGGEAGAQQHGRGGVQDIIIFLSDGAANTTPKVGSHWTLGAGWPAKPCGAGVQAATTSRVRSRVPRRSLHDRLRPERRRPRAREVPASQRRTGTRTAATRSRPGAGRGRADGEARRPDAPPGTRSARWPR